MISKKKLQYLYVVLIIIALILTIIIIVLKVLKVIKNKKHKKNQDNFNNLKEDSILLPIPNDNIKTINVVENIKSDEIPLNIFMCWYNKNLPPKMNENINKIKEENPEFNVYIFDDNDCRNMIEKYFIKEVVDAFDTLIPGAYKADLWRYCVLYLYGGIYQDIKLEPINGFKYQELTDKEYFVRDIKDSHEGIYNAFMICKKNNKILEKAIKQIIQNCKEEYYGTSVWDPTGPLLLKKLFSENELNEIQINLTNEKENIRVVFNNKEIIKMYNGYRDEQTQTLKDIKTLYYPELWKETRIYKQAS